MLLATSADLGLGEVGVHRQDQKGGPCNNGVTLRAVFGAWPPVCFAALHGLLARFDDGGVSKADQKGGPRGCGVTGFGPASSADGTAPAVCPPALPPHTVSSVLVSCLSCSGDEAAVVTESGDHGQPRTGLLSTADALGSGFLDSTESGTASKQ